MMGARNNNLVLYNWSEVMTKEPSGLLLWDGSGKLILMLIGKVIYKSCTT